MVSPQESGVRIMSDRRTGKGTRAKTLRVADDPKLTLTQLCARCGISPRLGACARCKSCLKADAEKDRLAREEVRARHTAKQTLAADAIVVAKPKRQRSRMSLEARIARLTDRSGGPHAVWPWLGSCSRSNGYPQLSFHDPVTGKYTTNQVHRLVMQLKLGRRLERHEYVLHAPGCPQHDVNPAHLRIGSQRENLADAKAERRLGRRLASDEVRRIVKLNREARMSVASLAALFRVSNVSIVGILKGKTHSAITGIPRAAPSKGGRPKGSRNKSPARQPVAHTQTHVRVAAGARLAPCGNHLEPLP
jgi:hypothetical protein